MINLSATDRDTIITSNASEEIKAHYSHDNRSIALILRRPGDNRVIILNEREAQEVAEFIRGSLS